MLAYGEPQGHFGRTVFLSVLISLSTVLLSRSVVCWKRSVGASQLASLLIHSDAAQLAVPWVTCGDATQLAVGLRALHRSSYRSRDICAISSGTNTCTHIYMYVYMYIYMYICTCICIHICTYMYRCLLGVSWVPPGCLLGASWVPLAYARTC